MNWNKLNTQTPPLFLTILLSGLLTFAPVYIPLSYAQETSDPKNQDPPTNAFSNDEAMPLSDPLEKEKTSAKNVQQDCKTCAQNTYQESLTENKNNPNLVERTLGGQSPTTSGKDPSKGQK